jgi:ParB family chromosome partitioning protein
MTEYRSGAMSLEQLMGFAISDDHKAQEEVWFEQPYAELSPQTIRRLLTKSLVESGDRRARFIGAKAYEEAGGVVTRDLFEPENEGYFADNQLLDRMVGERLQQQSEMMKKEGWGWVEVIPETDYGRLARFSRIKPVEVELSDEEEGRISALSERYDELVTTIEETGSVQIEAELDQVTVELDTLRAKKEVWPETKKAGAGVVISLDGDGSLQITRGLVKPQEQKPEKDRAGKANRKNAEREALSSGYSESILVDLSAHRTAALREVLASQPERALTALLHALVLRIFFEDSETCIEVTPSTVLLAKFSRSVGESKASAALLARQKLWLDRLPEKSHLWEWLEALDQGDRLALLGYCTGMTVNAVHGQWGDKRRNASANALAHATGLDMADWWRPTHGGFFEHLTKDQIVKVVAEAVSREAAHPLAGRKKDQITRDAEALLADKRWLPEPLRTTKEEGDAATSAVQ